MSDALRSSFKMRIAARTIRSIDINGGIDRFLIDTPNRKLTRTAITLKNKILRKLPTADVSLVAKPEYKKKLKPLSKKRTIAKTKPAARPAKVAKTVKAKKTTSKKKKG